MPTSSDQYRKTAALQALKAKVGEVKPDSLVGLSKQLYDLSPMDELRTISGSKKKLSRGQQEIIDKMNL